MGLHETMKQAIIVEEIIEFFLEQGETEIDLSIRINKQTSVVTVKLQQPNPQTIRLLKDTIRCHRNQELEEYGWEVLIENHPLDLLQSLGMLIDDVDIVEQEHQTTITLTRYSS